MFDYVFVAKTSFGLNHANKELMDKLESQLHRFTCCSCGKTCYDRQEVVCACILRN